ncbi:MAG: hypothetical protein Q7S74_02185 [Nanoarchaeota archaeon]|nr:hypothetical protein [Nanoarchaeota archaeon]
MAKDNDGYYAIAAFLSIIITMIIHYFFLSRFEWHSSLHVGIGLAIFFVLSAIFSAIFERLW